MEGGGWRVGGVRRVEGRGKWVDGGWRDGWCEEDGG